MSRSKGRTVISWALLALLAAAFTLSSLGKLTGAATQMFADWGYPAWFATLIGVLELAGGVGLLIPRTTRLAILVLTVVMFGAAYTHLASGEGIQVIRPFVFLAAMWGAWFLRGRRGMD